MLHVKEFPSQSVNSKIFYFRVIGYFSFTVRVLHFPRFLQTTSSSQQIQWTTVQTTENNQFECLFNYTGKSKGRSNDMLYFLYVPLFPQKIKLYYLKNLQIKKLSPKLTRTKAYIFLLSCLFTIFNASWP